MSECDEEEEEEEVVLVVVEVEGLISGPGKTLVEPGRRVRRPSSGPEVTGCAPPMSHSGATMTGQARAPPGQPTTARRSQVLELGRILTTRNFTPSR